MGGTRLPFLSWGGGVCRGGFFDQTRYPFFPVPVLVALGFPSYPSPSWCFPLPLLLYSFFWRYFFRPDSRFYEDRLFSPRRRMGRVHFSSFLRRSFPNNEIRHPAGGPLVSFRLS